MGGLVSKPGDGPIREWLRRGIATGRLLTLPNYRDPDGHPRRPDRVARALLADLDTPGPSGRRSAEASAAGFRAWVEAQPRCPVPVRRSRIDLTRCSFPSLRSADEIHEALENLARPSMGRGPAFWGSERKPGRARRKPGLRRSRLLGVGLGPYAPILALVACSFAIVWLSSIPLGFWAENPSTAGWLVGTLLFLALAMLPGLVRSRADRRHQPRKPAATRRSPARASTKPATRSGTPANALHDPWLDDLPTHGTTIEATRDHRR